jgi:hypothetical protein
VLNSPSSPERSFICVREDAAVTQQESLKASYTLRAAAPPINPVLVKSLTN